MKYRTMKCMICGKPYNQPLTAKAGFGKCNKCFEKFLHRPAGKTRK